MSVVNIVQILLAAILTNNFILSKFLGICPFLGVSKKLDTAVGMSAAVIFVMLIATAVTWPIQTYLLTPNDLDYLQTIVFILVIAALVQFVEIFLKKYMVGLYNSLGVYLPLITTNCTVLYVTQANISEGYNLLQTVVNSIAVPLGFMLVLFIFSCIRERLDSAETPAAWKGNPVALVVAGLMALALSGLAGIA